jgi:homoserine kinase type II
MHEDEAELAPGHIGPRATIHDVSVRDLAARFSLQPARAWKDLGGTYNLNVLVHGEDGDYVLRVHRPWVTQERLSYVQQVRMNLSDAGLTVPTALPGAQGRTILSAGDRLAEVEPFVPHDPVVHSLELYRRAFSTLGQLHDALRTRAPLPPIPPAVSNYGTVAQLRRWLASTKDSLGAQGAEAGREEAIAVCDRVSSLLSEIEARQGEFASALPPQVIHGDFRLGNVVFRGHEVVAILDFDFLGVRERLYDVAYATYWMLVALRLDPSCGNTWVVVRDVLHAYDESSPIPLSPNERSAFPYMLARVPLYWVAEAGVLPDPVAALTQARNGVDLAAASIRHAPRIVSTLASH